MKVQIATSTTPVGEANRSGRQFTASYLIDSALAIDAGAIGWIDSLERQREISDVVLSHPHLDHIASLPMFLDNVYGARPEGVKIWASEHTEKALRKHCFNGVMWPDLTSLDPEDAKHLQFQRMRPGESFEVGELTVTPLSLDHVGPTFGFLIDDGRSGCAIISDTCEVEDVWETLNQAPRLDLVLLECSFPNRMQWLADVSKHLTPAGFAKQAKQLQRDARLVAIHVKAAFAEETSQELAALKPGGFHVASASEVFEI